MSFLNNINGSTIAMLSALVFATGAIVIKTWYGAQATTNTSHVIQATEADPSSKR